MHRPQCAPEAGGSSRSRHGDARGETSLHEGDSRAAWDRLLAMAWFKREKKPIENPTPVDERRVRTEGLWTKCSSCRAIIWRKDREANWEVCPKCDHHFRLGARRRLDLLLDNELWTENDADLASSDPLHFTDTKEYSTRLEQAQPKLR